jgi:zinc protease
MSSIIKPPKNMEIIDVLEVKDRRFIYKLQLDNGLTILLRPDDYNDLVALNIWYNVGSSHEKPGTTGIAHLFEHLMFRETELYPDGEFDQKIENMGGSTNAGTWVDWTFYIDYLPAKYLHTVLEMELERMKNLKLTDIQLNTEREVVINERLYRIENNPNGTIDELLFNTAFTKHPYRWDTIGYMEDIKSISIDDCQEFYKTYYSPNNAIMVISGNIDVQKISDKIATTFGNLPKANIDKIELPCEPPQTERKIQRITCQIESPIIAIAYHIPAISELEYRCAEVISKWLFEEDGSKLSHDLEQKGISYQVEAFVTPFKNPGLLVLTIELTDKLKVDAALAYIDEVLDNSIGSFNAHDLQKCIHLLETEYYNSIISQEQWAYALGFYETVLQDFAELYKYSQSLQQLDVARVNNAYEKYLNRKNSTVILAEPL